VLACGLVAAVLPGDAITMLLEILPLYLLFELSLIVAGIAERRSAVERQAADEPQ
jgi:Sec-independent protein secretion pathway component TatC